MVAMIGANASPAVMAEELAERGFVAVEGFAPPDLVRRLAAESDRLLAAGLLRPAKVGKGEQRRLDRRVRGDLIRWFDPAEPSPPQLELLERVEQLRLALNQRLFLGLFDFEACHARYPVASFYRRHRDRFARSGRRIMTLVTYLNADWREGDGGELRIHLPEGGTFDIAPRGGRAVLFFSDRFPHEVLPTRRERLGIAGWFRGRP
ncbi:MAG: 2OG-Fe(II) oxygenase [Planctomycetota bacterium]